VFNGVTLGCVLLVVIGVFATGVAIDHRRELRRQEDDDS
jgi:hypothetical protein